MGDSTNKLLRILALLLTGTACAAYGQEAKQPGAKRRLHEVAEARIHISLAVRTGRGREATGKSQRQIVHGN